MASPNKHQAYGSNQENPDAQSVHNAQSAVIEPNDPVTSVQIHKEAPKVPVVGPEQNSSVSDKIKILNGNIASNMVPEDHSGSETLSRTSGYRTKTPSTNLSRSGTSEIAPDEITVFAPTPQPRKRRPRDAPPPAPVLPPSPESSLEDLSRTSSTNLSRSGASAIVPDESTVFEPTPPPRKSSLEDLSRTSGYRTKTPSTNLSRSGTSAIVSDEIAVFEPTPHPRIVPENLDSDSSIHTFDSRQQPFLSSSRRSSFGSDQPLIHQETSRPQKSFRVQELAGRGGMPVEFKCCGMITGALGFVLACALITLCTLMIYEVPEFIPIKGRHSDFYPIGIIGATGAFLATFSALFMYKCRICE